MQIYDDKIFNNPIKIIICFNNTEVIAGLEEIEEYKRQSYYLLGYIRYDARNIFLNKEIQSEYPLLYFEVYEYYKPFNVKKTTAINLYTEKGITFEEYKQALTTIKDEISEGNTYEVNYTYPNIVYTSNTSEEIYEALLNKQKTSYNTFITNEWETLLSFSPELFFKVKNNRILTKPMKGTIERGKTEEDDEALCNFLRTDTKNKAENVMIVDLLRNDLSRIAKTGTVKVEKLFEIEKHKTLYQMTSEISAELKENTTVYEILKAIFPCGSITGAPKISTMDIIDKLEKYNREIYCGAIGYIDKDETIFSVPIRILQKKNNESHYKYFVGGAIVWDSRINDEWKETITKSKILESNIDFNLIETMVYKKNEIELFEYHKNRLKNSAQELGYKFNEQDFNFSPKENCIVRCELTKDGFLQKEYKDITEIKSKKIKLSNHHLKSNNPFLKHKTTFRPWYKIDLTNYYDIIFYNERDEITEGTRTNIVLHINGKLYTPKLSSGLLNGTYRQYLIDKNKIEEKVLYKSDLTKAEKIYCINSVRGMVEVEYDNN